MATRILDKFIDHMAQTTAGAHFEGRSTHSGDRVSRLVYRYLNRRLRNVPDVKFLNYGYAPLRGEGPALEAADESNRVYIQLYDSVAGAIDLKGARVLEMSSGRGGGASYVKRYFEPEHYLGIDRSPLAVAFCGQHHRTPGLNFAIGDALHMPLGDNKVDVLINIEASHDYPDYMRFLSEVRRVLRPGGHFLYADFRRAKHCAAWHKQLAESGLNLVHEEDITSNVVKGLELNTEHNIKLVRKHMPLLLKPFWREFAGARGSYVHRAFDSGKQRYIRFVLQNP